MRWMILFTSKHIVLPLFTAKYPLHGFSVDQKREFDKKLYESRVTVLIWFTDRLLSKILRLRSLPPRNFKIRETIVSGESYS